MHTLAAALLVSCAVLGADPSGKPPAPAPDGAGKISATYPVISEVLFNVPSGASGDANQDGVRSASGDEFVEIYNSTAAAINLRGYRLLNRIAYNEPDSSKGVRFMFPDVSLPPGGVAVVFNGHDAQIVGPMGDSHHAPKGTNAKFHDALVFHMDFKGRGTSFNNSADFVVLVAPDNKPVDVVTWGDCDPKPPANALRTETVKAGVKGSVQRITADAAMVEHRTINDELFSPGAIPAAGVATQKKSTEESKPDPAPKPGKSKPSARIAAE